MKSERYLYDLLLENAASDMYPLHMPGHKRHGPSMADPFSFDITEVEGFDNLHHPEGILREAEQRAARVFGAEETHFLVNGSTCGLLAAVTACAEGGTLLMGRNAHRCIYHAAVLGRLDTAYLYPDTPEEPLARLGIAGRIRPEDVERALAEHPGVRAVQITSPTYDGLVSDVEAIAQVVHRRGTVLIVDEAHGAHFGFHPAFPQSALRQGADVVIQSVHKTLPSLTSTALLHINGERADRRKIRRMLQVFQTSSPSYVLMASIDQCVRFLQEQGAEAFGRFAERTARFRERTAGLSCLSLPVSDDPAKILIGTGTSGLSGPRICAILREAYHLETEMAAPRYALALMSPGDTQEGFDRLCEALLAMDAEFSRRPVSADSLPAPAAAPRAQQALPVWRAFNARSTPVPLEKAGGRICAEFSYLYPPGIPLLVPGERVPDNWADAAGRLRASGCILEGTEDPEGRTVRVLADTD